MNKKHDPALHIPSEYRNDEEVFQLLNSDDVQKLRSILVDTELVHRLVLCQLEGSQAVLAATNERLLVCDKKFITSKTISLQYPDIAAIAYNAELVYIDMTIMHAGGSITITNIDKQHGERMLEYLTDLIGGHYREKGVKGRVLEYTNELLYSEEIA